MDRFEDVVVGAGCAGLSLALALVRRGARGRSLCVIEPRTSLHRDRTWCFWDASPHPFSEAIAHRWSRWTLRHRGATRTHASTRYRYCELPSDRFARQAIAALDRHGVELRFGVRAEDVAEEADGVRVDTDQGPIRARRVHDGRPPTRQGGGLLQHFAGLHVRVDRPVFDPETVTLMDFDVPHAAGCDFVYVLPYSPVEALVESTSFSEEPLGPAEHEARVHAWLADRMGVGEVSVERQEHGVLPMAAVRPRPRAARRIYRIGTAAGLVRPATGYAFLAIQQWSDAFAERLCSATLPPPPPVRGRTTRVLDAIFLGVLRRDPSRGPALFERLYARVTPDALVRFLSDEGRVRDRLAVVRAMPPAPFLAEAWSGRRDWRAA